MAAYYKKSRFSC